MITPQELRNLAEQIKRKFGDAGRVPVEPDALTALLDQIEQLQAERDVLAAENESIRELMNCYNLGGWTDSLALIKERDALRTEKKAREDQKPHLWIDEYAVLYKSRPRDANADHNLHALYLSAGAKE
jgi:hypothetical protein